MDRELPDEILERIQATAMSHPEVTGTHETRTRQAGHKCFVQLHLELDEDLSLKRAHEIADEVEAFLLLYLSSILNKDITSMTVGTYNAL